MARPKSNISPTRAGTKPSTPVHETIDTLVQGISQQPQHLRLPGQGEVQENAWSSPVEGLTKRNPAMLQLLFNDRPLNNFYLEMFQLGAAEVYAFLLFPADDFDETNNLWLRIRNTNGRPAALNVHGTDISIDDDANIVIGENSYLWSNPVDGDDNPRLYANYSLINTASGSGSFLNRTKTAAMADTTTPARENNGIVFVQAVQYQVTYSLTLTYNGTNAAVAPVTTPAATDDDNFISTSSVAQQLTDNINAVNGWNAVRSDYIIEVTRDDGNEFTMNMDDARSNVLARAFTDSVGFLSELPIRAPNNYLVNVESDPTTSVDDRWLKFRTRDESDIGEGAWSEATAPGIAFELNDETMPFHVRRESENVIFIGPADGAERTEGNITYEFPLWGIRSTGNLETVPTPDIVGKVIRDHAFFRERYVLAGGETVQFSEIGDSYNLFQDSVLGITGQDGFAVNCASEVTSDLQWILPIDETLLIWSSSSQFQVRSADSEALTAQTALVVRLSNIVMNDTVKPKLAAAKVLFSTDEYGFSHVREFDFFSNRQARLGLNLGGSNDITLNLPKYIEGMISHWDVSESADYAVARTPDDPQSLYIYKYQWTTGNSGLQKIQASWSKWIFSGEVQWVKFMENNLWIVQTLPNRTELLEIKSDELVTHSSPLPKLDRQIWYPEANLNPAPYLGPGTRPRAAGDITATYDSLENKTTFTLPFPPSDGFVLQAVTRFTNTETQNEGLILGQTTTNTLECSQPGDWTNARIAFGEPYNFRYTFTNAYVPEANQANNRRVGKLKGRTQVLTWEIHHTDTGYYFVRVKRKNRTEDSISIFRARTTGIDNNLLTTEQNVIETGSLRVPVLSRNTDCSITIESDSWLPLTVSSASWEGTYSDRSRG